jgi:hypothetical protein
MSDVTLYRLSEVFKLEQPVQVWGHVAHYAGKAEKVLVSGRKETIEQSWEFVANEVGACYELSNGQHNIGISEVFIPMIWSKDRYKELISRGTKLL